MIDTGDQTKTEKQPTRIARINPWIWLALLWLTGIALGYSGFSIYAALNGENWSRLDIVYRLLQLITLESGSIPRPIPWQLDVARFGLPLMAAWTAVRAVMTLFREQVAFLSLRFRKNHVVICGLGQKGFLLACDFLNAGWKVVVIEQNQDHPLIDKIRWMGAIVLSKDTTDPQTLLRAGIRRAYGLIAVTGNDRSNAEVAVQVARVLDGRSTPLHCLIHIVDLDLWDLLHEWQLSMVQNPALRIELFNIYQRTDCRKHPCGEISAHRSRSIGTQPDRNLRRTLVPAAYGPTGADTAHSRGQTRILHCRRTGGPLPAAGAVAFDPKCGYRARIGRLSFRRLPEPAARSSAIRNGLYLPR
jgi:hypothetical protein